MDATEQAGESATFEDSTLKSRFRTLLGRGREAVDPAQDAGAARVLSGLRDLPDATSSREWAETVAAALPRVIGLPIASILLAEPASGRLAIAASKGPGNELPGDTGWSSLCENLARRSMLAKAGEVLEAADLQDTNMRSGLSAPIMFRGAPIGAVCIFSAGHTPARHSDVLLAEKYLGLAAPFLNAARSTGRTALPANRLDAELRRAGRSHAARSPISLTGLTLDPVTDRSLVGDVAVSLSRTEFEVLYTLAAAPGRPLSCASLTRAAGASSALDVTVHRLRRKLARAPEGEGLIKTVRGKGYMLVPPGLPARAG